MKKLFPIFVAVVMFLSACGKSGPQEVAIPDAKATVTAIAPGQSSSNAEAGSTRTSPADGMIETFIPAGVFTMGGVDPRAAENEKPIHQVSMPGFWMDKVEVTNGMYALCANAGACRLPQEYRSNSRDKYYGDAQYKDYPVVYVTWLQAKTYCEWAAAASPPKLNGNALHAATTHALTPGAINSLMPPAQTSATWSVIQPVLATARLA